MTKRKLSERQQARIQQLQQRRVRRAEKNKATAPVLDETDLGAEQEGLLVAFYGVYADVEDRQQKIHRCYLRQNLGTVVAGDQVVWRAKPKMRDGVVVAVKPRKTLLTRPSAPGKIKAVAANIDQMILVVAAQPRPAVNMIDSYLAAAEINHFKAVIVCNKSDLLSNAEHADLLALLDIYRQLNYPVILASARQQTGLLELRRVLARQTSILVGQSGVGKSSLIAQLLPAEAVRVRASSFAGEHGTHTTTAARLYHLVDDGVLIDSPGVRDFRLWDVAPEKIAEGFIEFRDYLGRCQFRDCKHGDESHCALRQAATAGAISSARLQSYRRIISALKA